MNLKITGGTLLDPETGQAAPADVMLAERQVVAVSAPGLLPDLEAESFDATGLLLAPGLVDVQVNGAAGIDITAEPERLWEVAAALPRHGVTSFVVNIVTSDEKTRQRAIAALAAGRPAGVPAGAVPLGLSFEGPMLSPQRNGAHAPDLLRSPSAELVDGWSPQAGVLMTTIAPELPGALEVIELLAGRGVVVSVGHTAASMEQVEAAVEAGARAVTHLHNAMAPMGNREPGPVGAVLGGDGLIAALIVDGLHVHPRTVAASRRALGRDRFLAVSDTTSALDQPDGPGVLGGLEVVIGGGAIRLADGSGTLAGSAVGLDDCFRLLVEFTSVTPADALAAATTVPADLLGRDDLGRLRPGSAADVVLFDPALRTVATVVAGQLLYQAPDQAVRTTERTEA
jgi:N-acetylglucosamine-6-phosphate deacetylase